jgi:site-specific recombinase XerD
MNKSITNQAMKSSKTDSQGTPEKAMLFNELAMRYVSTQSDHLSAEILNNRISDLSEQLLSFFGLYQVTDINSQRLRKFVFMLETNGSTEKKINAYLVTFRACMRYGYINRWITDASMTKPLLNLNETFLPDQPMLTDNEFSSLYQGLVQDISHGTFH